MIYIDIIIIVLTFVMVLVYLPKLRKSLKRDRKYCIVCNTDMLANTSTRTEVERYSPVVHAICVMHKNAVIWV